MRFIAYMRANGIDATAKASSLVSIGKALSLEGVELNLERLVYLPINKSVVEKLKFLDLA